jgi:hypothetical protein
MEEVRRVMFPYGMAKNPDGTWTLFNRKYKPVGTISCEWEEWDTPRHKMKFKALRQPTLAKLERTLVFDVDKNGTPQLRQKAARQRRDAIANDVYRARSDIDHMNYAYPGDPRIQFEMDFTEDYEERKALERYERETKETG